MKIKIQTSLVTMARSYERGQEVEWPDKDAQRLIAAGYAEPAAEDNKPAATGGQRNRN